MADEEEARFDSPLVTGEIIISGKTPACSGATAYVSLEEISYADADAALVAEAVIKDVSHDPSDGDTSLPFELRANSASPAISPMKDYTVRVWIDVDGDGKQGRQDLYSDQSYRVLTRGFGRTVTVTLGKR